MNHVHPFTKLIPTHLAGRVLSSNIFLFLLVSVGFIFWRHGYPLVWDDTSVYKLAVQTWKVDGREDWLATFLAYIIPAFSEASPSGYRPIGSLLQSLFILAIDSTSPSWGHLFFVSCFVGGLAVAFKSVAERFIKSQPIVFACLALFMFSSPIAQSSWISYSGIPVLVPFFTCIGLLLYFEVCDRPKEGQGKLWILALLVIVSAWYREFMVALPLTILGVEMVQARRITRISLLAVALILFCLFPTVLPYLFFHLLSGLAGSDRFPGDTGWLAHGIALPLKPVFQLGHVHEQLARVWEIRGEVSHHLLNILSPSLLVLSFLGFVSLVLIKFRRQANEGGLTVEVGLSLAASLIGLISLAGMMVSSHDSWPYHFGILTLLLIAWVVDRRLAVWIAVFLAPFYLVYTERVHLAYVMMPVSIVVASVLERCWAVQSFGGKPRRLLRWAAGIALVVGVLDASTNPVAVRLVMSRISNGIETVAFKISERPSDRPVAIIGNALHVDDLRLYLDGGYQILWTIPSGHDRPQDVTETPEQLTKFLNAKLPTTDVYFLDIKQDYLPEKKGYHQHRFVAGCSVNTADLGLLHLTRAEYFMPDPLRWLGRREFYPFLGPPDLVDDFYYGPSPRPFFGRVEAEYHLYKVGSSEAKRWIPLGLVHLVDRNYFGFSIFAQNKRFFAIPVGEGDFAYERACRNGYSTFLESSSVDEVRVMVERLNVSR